MGYERLMTPLEIILEAQKKPLTTEDGDAVPLELAPPLSEDEISAFEAELPCKLPREIRELLSRCSGFTGGAADFVDFTGKSCNFGQEEVFPYGLPIAADGLGTSGSLIFCLHQRHGDQFTSLAMTRL